MGGPLTPERWRRVEALLHEALDLPVEQRAAYIARAAAGEDWLRGEVESLLANQDTGEPVLGRRVGLAAPARSASLASELPVGAALGAFRVLKLIGRGGMGEVYLAERADGAFEQQVAIKLMRPEAGEHLDRFHTERQILARLEHPGIARLLDGGVTADGRPFMAMEYVAGRPLTEYCQRLKLGLAARLALFDQVCEAVEFAHSHLVVHRDLKSGNILVTPQGRVKLLDFGVAKLLDPGAWPGGNAATRAAPLTPDHAAPEQLLGKPITTATDVYALGIVLHELLTGHLPWASVRHLPVSLALQRILTEDPPPASASAEQGALAVAPRLLRGDLDAIIVKAMRKDPRDRYPGITSFSADLRAHRLGQPVSAGPDRFWYRAGKFALRHRIALSVAAAFVAMMTAFTWQLATERDRALDAEQLARREAEAANQVSDYLVSMFEAASPEQAGGQAIAPRQLVDLGRQRLEGRMVEQPELRARMLLTLGQLYNKIGLLVDAERSLHEALQLLGTLARRAPLAEAQVLLELGRAQLRTAEFEDGERAIRQALEIWRERLPPGDRRIAEGLLALGQVQYELDRSASAIESLGHARRLFVALDGDDSVAAARVRKVLGSALHRSKSWDEARHELDAATTILRARLGAQHPALLETQRAYGLVLYEQGDFGAAEAVQRPTAQTALQVYGEDSSLAADYQAELASTLSAQGKMLEAVRLGRHALQIWRRTAGHDSPAVAIGLANLAGDLEDLGDYEQAVRMVDEALRITGGDPPAAVLEYHYASQLKARLLIRLGRVEDAMDVLRRELPETGGAAMDGLRGNRLMSIADVMRLSGKLDDAALRYAEAEVVLRSSRPPGDGVFHILKRRVALLRSAQGDHWQAVGLLREARDGLEHSRGARAPRTLEVQLELAAELLAVGDRAAAASLVADAAPHVDGELSAGSNAQVLLRRLERALGSDRGSVGRP